MLDVTLVKAYKHSTGKKRDHAIGRSKGGLTTKIHTCKDALGNPTGFYSTGGSVHDLCSSDALLDLSISHIWLADRAYDANARVIEPIESVQGNAVIPSEHNRLQSR